MATVAKYGRQHMKSIARRGFMATVARHWQGDARGYLAYLHQRGWHGTLEIAAERKISADLTNGATIVCVELPAMDTEIPF